MKVTWLDRSLITGPCLALVTSDAQFQKALDQCGAKKEGRSAWILTAHADATAHYLENQSGGQVCVVALRVKPDTTSIEIAGLLVHEAVHVWQQFKARIGEDSPSLEFEAYSIQTIAQRLMQAYSEQIN